MRSTFTVIIFIICSIYNISGQTKSCNYVRESLFLERFTSNPISDYDFARNTVTYYDGLGRPIQNVKGASSWVVQDIHTTIEYDCAGNKYREWLPVEGPQSDGSFLATESVKTTATGFYGDQYPYAETEYTQTPEMIEMNKRNPGKAWRDNNKYISKHKGLNSYHDRCYGCARFDVSNDGSLNLDNEFGDGTLHYEESVDEDNIRIIKFFDRDQRLVLERKCGESINLDTYYVYNKIGQLIYVLSPEASNIFVSQGNGQCNSTTIRKLCYFYSYDNYGRLVEKRLPGAEPEYYVYDKLDNVIFRQDGNMRKENKWFVVKFDGSLRKAVEGIATFTNETRSSLQEKWKDKMAVESLQASINNYNKLFYTDTCGISNFKPLVSYFYDNYDFWQNIVRTNQAIESGYSSGMDNATGLLTGKAVWGEWYVIMSSYRYDDKKRIVVECDYDLDLLDNVTTYYKYNFVGDLTNKIIVLNSSDLDVHYASEYSYSYDNWGMPVSARHRFNNDSWTILYENRYDNVARLTHKNIRPRKCTNKGCNIDYQYNVRDWLTAIKSPLFTQSLYYNSNNTGTAPRWNGSPSAMTFTSVDNDLSLDSLSVGYGYDGFDRLISVESKSPTDVNSVFSEGFSYDRNGNPVIISRGKVNANPVQYLSLDYSGNQIASIGESKPADGLYPDIPSIDKGDYSSEWTYDANGNRTSDPARGITSITYDYYNQPVKFTFSDGSTLTNYYRSDGTYYGRNESEAIISTVSSGSTRPKGYKNSTYINKGDFVFLNTIPSRLYIEGGYVDIDFDHSKRTYNYYIHDNQGSVRAVVDENGTLVQATDYSAYGVPSSRFVSTTSDKHLHLGLEWQPMKGIYGYYNNARFRDAILAGTFYQQDPLAEKYYPFTPYHYATGNPCIYIDLTGKYLVDNKNRRVTYSVKNGWSKNATADIKMVGNAMMKTKIGRDVLNSMIEAPHKISITIDNDTEIDKFGKTVSEGNKKFGIHSAKIVIYNKSIIQRKNIGDHILNDNLSEEDVLGAIGVHEGTHATDKESNVTSAKNSTDTEVLPDINEKKHIKELEKIQDEK